MNKKTFYVMVIKNEYGKRYAYADAIQNSNDLLSMFQSIKNLETVNACDTRHDADEIAHYWNETYKVNGTYAF